MAYRDARFFGVFDSLLRKLQPRLDETRLMQMGDFPTSGVVQLPAEVEQALSFQRMYLKQVAQVMMEGFYEACGVEDLSPHSSDVYEDPQDDLIEVILVTMEEMVVEAAKVIQKYGRRYLVRKKYAGVISKAPQRHCGRTSFVEEKEGDLSVLVLGDISPAGLTPEANVALHFPIGYFWEPCRELLRSASVCLSNLTCPLTLREFCPVEKEGFNVFVNFCESPELVDMLREGVDGLALANNHIFDLGKDGASDTERALLKGGLSCVGLRFSHPPFHFVRLKNNICFTSFAYYFPPSTFAAHMNSVYDAEAAQQYLKLLPIIFINGPHLVGPVEIYRRKAPIIYSTGDWIGPYPIFFGEDVTFSYRVIMGTGNVPEKHVLRYVELIPFKIKGHRPLPITDAAEAEQATEFVRKQCSRFLNTTVEAKDGKILVY
jgi:hypothetical protein